MRYPMPPVPTQAELDAAKAARLQAMRDEFAKAACTGLIANSKNIFKNAEECADLAYKVADAMLERRTKC